MKKWFKLISLTVLAIFTFNIGCTDLEIENLNDPDTVRVLSNPDDLLNLAGEAMCTWYRRTHEYSGPALDLATTSDVRTSSFCGMAYLSYEPRRTWINSPELSSLFRIKHLWNDYYTSLSDLSDVVKMINNGTQIGDNGEDNNMVLAWCYMMQGIYLGNLGLLFDKAKILDEDTDLAVMEYSKWNIVINAAVDKLDKAIKICEDNTFEIPDGWINGLNYDNEKLGRLANTFAGRFLVYCPRNASYAEKNIDWVKVENYLSKGITDDFAPVMYDLTWRNDFITYIAHSNWSRIDMRVINMLAPSQPDYYPLSGNSSDLPNYGEVLEGESDDARMYIDFEYNISCPYPADRGTYHFSHYRYSRYDNYLQTWTEPLPGILKAENDLLLAEAYMHNNKKTEALAILNDDNGTRNMRGQLPDLPADASDQEIYDAIYYEKLIECMFSSPFVEWCDMRRRDWLQPGSLLHYPVPGSELELLGEEYYTFGGREGVEGEDYSALTSGWPVKNHPYGGWRLPGLSSVKY